MRPWLSIVMPTYNGERFLGSALASVAAQGAEGLEIIAVDDGSTDQTLRILRQWSRRLPLMIIERRHSGDWIGSTVDGMAAARGQYLCWLHQDDIWSIRRLRALRGVADAAPYAVFVVHPCWYCDCQGRRIGYWRTSLPRARRLLRFAEVAAPLLVQCSIATCGTMFSAEAAREVGPPDAALRYHADWDYWLRLARLEATYYHPTPLASFRIHAGSQTIARACDADARLNEARLVLRRHLPELAACGGDPAAVAPAAVFSAELNHLLNSLLAGHSFRTRGFWRAASALGLDGAIRVLHDSRIIERCVSRLRASAGLRATVLAGLRSSVRRAAAETRGGAGETCGCREASVPVEAHSGGRGGWT